MAAAGSLEVLRCAQCGAPVPFVDAEQTWCEGCGSTVAVPPGIAERARERDAAQASRDAALKTLQAMPRSLPLWVGRALVLFLIAGLPIWVVVAILGWAVWGWFPTPLHMLGWGIMTPAFVVIMLMIDSMSAASYAKGKHALSAVPTSEGWSCRGCGAGFAFEDGALVGTCRYCGADNLLLHHSPRWESWLARARAQANANLGEAVYALKSARAGVRLTRIIVGAVLLPFWLLFCGPLLWAALLGQGS